MPSTHTSLHYHLVFSTRDRIPSIATEIRPDIHAYLGGILRNLGGTPLEVGGVADHVHILTGLKSSHSLADVLRDVKGDSSRWIRAELCRPKFAWQEGYGAFTVSRSDIQPLREYIRGQEAHHRRTTFQEEYLEFLRENGVEYDDRYLW